MLWRPSIRAHDPQSLSVRRSFRRNAHLMAWSIVIGVVNWWSGCKFLSHGCHCLSSPSFIVPSVYPSLSPHSSQLFTPPACDLYVCLSCCPFSYWFESWTRWHSWNIPSWNPSNCPVESHLVQLFTVMQWELFVLAANQHKAPSMPDLEVEGMPGCCRLVQMCRLIADPTMRKLFLSTISKHLQ